MNKLKARNNIIILAYILSQLIINNKFLLAHTTEINEIGAIAEQVTTWLSDCYSDEKISCDCPGDGYFDCRFFELNDVYISFESNSQLMDVMCYPYTETNINFLLERKFKSILPKTRYLKVVQCNNFKHEIYMNDKVQEIVVKMNHMTKTKVTLVYNIDLPVEPTEDSGHMHTYIGHIDLQLIIKSNRNEIREADIISIALDIFSKQNQLETLTLSAQGLRNQYLSLQNLTQTFFKNFTTLRQLDLAGNNMKTLDANIFAELTQLNCLNLSRNEIRELSESLFVYQRQLSILDLSHNLLTHLPPHLFDHTSWLWELKLGGNQLHDTTNLMENLKPLHYLHRLDVSQNQLQNIRSTETSVNITPRYTMRFGLQPENFAGTISSNKSVINLSGNRLREFPLDWIVATNITCPFEINLEHNLIENIFALQNLQYFSSTADCVSEIKMTGNPIVCDCKLAWIYSENYRSLFNGLQCVQTSTKLVKDIAQLRRNEMCAWQPVMCPRKCNCYTQFEFLHIQCNGAQHTSIEQLPRPEQVGLKSSVLDISNNNFIVLPLNTTFGYGNVSQLNASYNKITSISVSQLPTNLTVLDLRNNRIKSLNAEFLRTYLNDSTKLQFLYLSGNPWICDCSTQQLLYTIRTHRTRIPDVDQLLCVNQPNDTFLIANVREMCPTPVNVEYYATEIRIALSIISLLCIIVLLLCIYIYIFNIN
ncbi:protein toll-like [Bactrocera dorsalis]|uniref:Protein toll-like n=1 Tax=Bactrocera dorsalis TaxID=27457 RepID=A0ABM3J3M0_BACDO|nr:protein toll-like [Bactrocera dorsalis]